MSQSASMEVFGAQIIDPQQNLDQQQSLFVHNKKVMAIDASAKYTAKTRVNASGLILCPGFIDLNANCREPGFEHIATIKSETTAAVAQGITTLVCPPDLRPVIDNKAAAELIINRARQANLGRVLPIGAMTKKLNGTELAEMAALKEAGCIAISNASKNIVDKQILLNAFNYARSIDIPIILDLADSDETIGVVDESPFSAQTGLPSSPKEWELINLNRYLYLVEKSGIKAHFSNLSCAQSVELIKQVKQTNPNISADTSIMHLSFNHRAIADFNSNFNIKPPLRSEEDRQALIKGLEEGIIDTVTSLHRPSTPEQKNQPFAQTQVGSSTIDSLPSVLLHIAGQRHWPDHQVVDLLTRRAASCLNLNSGTLAVGHSADFVLLDLNQQYQLQAGQLLSASKNSPFIGSPHRGKIRATFKSGKQVYACPAAN